MSTDAFRREIALAGLALVLGAAQPALAQKVGFNCITDGGTNCTSAIPDAAGQVPGVLTSTITVPAGSCPTVGRVCVSLGVEHSARGDVSVDLTHNATTSALLAVSPGDDGDDVFGSFNATAPYAGGSGDGAWTLTLRDNANGEYGALNNWRLGLCCGDGCGTGLVSATPASGLVTTELGGTAQFQVELSCPPDFQVTLPVASSDVTEGVVRVASLVFTAANQTQPQTVTVTGQDDSLVDGNIPYTVNLGTAAIGASFAPSVAPADLYNPPSVYLGSNPVNVGVVNIDNEQVTGGLRATKTVAGVFQPGGAVTYTVAITNAGPGTQQDNPGAEFTDVLPASLDLLSATATGGTAVATMATNTVTWNGTLAAKASATITITARIKADQVGQTIGNQGTLAFDADGDGGNESSGVTDDPGVAGPADPTRFAVPVAIPTLSAWGLTLLGVIMVGVAWRWRRRAI